MIEQPATAAAAPRGPGAPALFSYGTLLDGQLLAVVLGRRAGLPRVSPALLPDHRCVYVRDARYPVVVPAPGEHVPGGLLAGLTRTDWDRLWFYESADYELVECVVTTATGARRAVMFAGGTTAAGTRAWSLREWQLRYRTAALRRIRRVMAAYERHSPGASRRPSRSKPVRSILAPGDTSKSTQ